MVAHDFINEIGSINFVLQNGGLSKSAFYYKPRPSQRGRRATMLSLHTAGYMVANEAILCAIQ